MGIMQLFNRQKSRAGVGRILIVDDEEDLVSTIKSHLEWYNYEVSSAEDGREGLEKAIEQKPDLILLDISMPNMNGHQMLECVRKNPQLSETPVIMLTALFEPADIEAASSCGINDYVTKPFELNELVNKIEAVLGG